MWTKGWRGESVCDENDLFLALKRPNFLVKGNWSFLLQNFCEKSREPVQGSFNS